MTSYRALSVGQCALDSGTISHELLGLDISTIHVHSAKEMWKRLESESFDLVLLNRIFDRTGEEALSFIPKLREQYGETPCLLVSNYEEAQKAAVQLGARYGFGKRQLGSGEVGEILMGVLGR